MSELTKKSRPQFRNINITDLRQYRLPAAGIMSILHRVSGAAMFLLLPLMIWIFDLSLTSELSYAQLMEFTASPLVKIILCGLVWVVSSPSVCRPSAFGVRSAHWSCKTSEGARWSVGVMAIALLSSVVVWLKIFGVL